MKTLNKLPLWLIILFIILLTMYPIVELTRVIVVRDILSFHCSLASPAVYGIELGFMWLTYFTALFFVGCYLRGLRKT
jgi:hypothetical protein